VVVAGTERAVERLFENWFALPARQQAAEPGGEITTRPVLAAMPEGLDFYGKNSSCYLQARRRALPSLRFSCALVVEKAEGQRAIPI